MDDTTTEQKRHERDATRTLFERRLTFAELQASPNPLTPDEIKTLKQRRPDLWGFLPNPK